MNKDEIFEVFYAKEKSENWNNFKIIEESIDTSNEIYKYIDDIILMLDNDKSYIRMRGFRIICKLAKWDDDNKINSNIDKILEILDDDKPTIVRMCLSSIHELILNKEKLVDTIEKKLLCLNTDKYKDSMRSLIKNDITEIIENYL